MESNKKIKVGVIGLGGAGRAHVRRLNRNPYVSEIFGYDIKKIKDIEDVKIVGNLDELISNVDAVTICTPDKDHIDGIIMSLKAGKHVLSEKPMTASSDQTSKLAPYIKKYSKLIFGVHHQMRCSPAFLKAKEVINSGKLGKIFYIEANYWHDMRDRYKKFDNWREKEGQSLIFAHGCHPVDLVTHLLGEMPASHTTYVSKNSFSEYNALYTSATTLLHFPSKVVGKIHINSSCTYPEIYDLQILGEKGTYIDGVLYTRKEGFVQVADFFADSGWFGTEMIIRKMPIPRKVLSLIINLYLRTVNFLFNLYMRAGSVLSIKAMKEPDFGFRRFPLTSYNHDYASQYIIDNFIAAIQGKEKIITGFDEAAAVIELCEELEKQGLKSLQRKTPR